MAAKQVPPPLTAGGRRISERSYESAFARLPEDEVHRLHSPGAGPAGSLDDGARNWPLLAFTVGFALAFVTFAVAHWAPLALGFLLMLAGLVWGLVRARPLRLRRGVGTVRSGR
jgi:hypothetical protein